MRRSYVAFCLLLLCLPVRADYDLVDVYPRLTFKHPVLALPHPLTEGAWLVVEQAGRIFSTATDRKKQLIDIHDRVRSGGEKGLLGAALHPQFPEQAYIFLSYTGVESGELTSFVSRFALDKKTLHIDKNSEMKIISVTQPYGNHNGGHIAFASDGMLYIGWGDGGSGGDPKEHGQNTQTLLGALLRIDVSKLPYRIPADNPYVNKPSFRPEIYAYGLRNPWRWSVDRQNRLWLADVGQNEVEEINLIEAGGNYGWNIMEGDQCYKRRQCPQQSLQQPIAVYGHDEGESVTGGYVYYGKDKNLLSHYLFADFISGKIWALETGNYKTRLIWSGRHNISSFAQDPAGEIYVLSYFQGKLLKLTPR